MTSRQFLLAALVFWLAFGLVAGLQVWISMITHGHSMVRLFGYHVAVWWIWVIPTALIVLLAQRFPVSPFRPTVVAAHFLAATTIGLLHALYSLGLMLWLRPYDDMTASASEIHFIQALLTPLLLEWVLYLLVLGAVMAQEYSRRSRANAIEAADLRRSLADARLRALEVQLQPHFLFNTLNAIAGLVRTSRQQEAVNMIAGLGELLRYSLDHAGRQRVKLGEETAMLTRYLEIHEARFPDRLSFSVEMDDSVLEARVPILVLQPLVENAIRHGIDQTSTLTHVEVRARHAGGCLRLEVRNPGRLDAAAAEGIGLKNTRERLQVLYGGDAHFELKQSGDHVIASIDLPFVSLP